MSENKKGRSRPKKDELLKEGFSSEENKPEPKNQTFEKPVKYRIAKGKAITCKKGLLGPGAVIKPEFIGREEDLELLVDKGYVEKY